MNFFFTKLLMNLSTLLSYNEKVGNTIYGKIFLKELLLKKVLNAVEFQSLPWGCVF